jgi:hypothetical protein
MTQAEYDAEYSAWAEQNYDPDGEGEYTHAEWLSRLFLEPKWDTLAEQTGTDR